MPLILETPDESRWPQEIALLKELAEGITAGACLRLRFSADVEFLFFCYICEKFAGGRTLPVTNDERNGSVCTTA